MRVGVYAARWAAGPVAVSGGPLRLWSVVGARPRPAVCGPVAGWRALGPAAPAARPRPPRAPVPGPLAPMLSRSGLVLLCFGLGAVLPRAFTAWPALWRGRWVFCCLVVCCWRC